MEAEGPEYIQDNEEGYTAKEFLSAYVERVRTTSQWPRLSTHRHLEHLRWYWLRDLGKNPTSHPEEMTAAFAASVGHGDEDYLWYAVAKAWNPTYLPALVEQIRNGHPERDVRVAALSCLVQCVPGELARVGEALVAEDERSRLIEIALELVNCRYWYPPWSDEKPSGSVTEAAMVDLPAPYDEVARSARALSKKEPLALSVAATDLICTVLAKNEEHRLFRVALDQHVPLPIEDDIRWLLANTDDSDAAVQAIEAAIRRGMTDEIRDALTHRFSHVASRALRAVAEPLGAPLPANLLALSQSKGSPVRKTLVTLLDARPHSKHIPVLLELAQDDYSVSMQPGDASEEYPIARGAVDVLAKSESLPPETGEQLYALAIDTRDPTLRYQLFVLIAKTFGTNLQLRLLSVSLRPGQSEANWLAAGALLVARDRLSAEVVGSITADVLLTPNEKVAVRLAAVLALRGDFEAVQTVAQVLATDRKRRVLLVPIASVLTWRNRQAAEQVATLLPSGHPAADWARRGGPGPLEETILEDLGDAPSVSQVAALIRAWTKSSS